MDGNPQVENGYVRIANEIMDALIKLRIPGEQRQVLDFIIRMTYGWNRKEFFAPLSEFSEMTGIKVQNVHRAIKGLLKRNLVLIKKDDDKEIMYSFNKKYKTWKPSSKKITIIKSDYNPSSKVINPSLYKDNKDITPISPKKKKRKTSLTDDFPLTEHLKKYALGNRINPDKVDALFESFKNYHISEGNLKMDWDRAWYTWVRNAPDYSKWAVTPQRQVEEFKTTEQEDEERWKRIRGKQSAMTHKKM